MVGDDRATLHVRSSVRTRWVTLPDYLYRFRFLFRPVTSRGPGLSKPLPPRHRSTLFSPGRTSYSDVLISFSVRTPARLVPLVDTYNDRSPLYRLKDPTVRVSLESPVGCPTGREDTLGGVTSEIKGEGLERRRGLCVLCITKSFLLLMYLCGHS